MSPGHPYSKSNVIGMKAKKFWSKLRNDLNDYTNIDSILENDEKNTYQEKRCSLYFSIILK